MEENDKAKIIRDFAFDVVIMSGKVNEFVKVLDTIMDKDEMQRISVELCRLHFFEIDYPNIAKIVNNFVNSYNRFLQRTEVKTSLFSQFGMN